MIEKAKTHSKLCQFIEKVNLDKKMYVNELEMKLLYRVTENVSENEFYDGRDRIYQRLYKKPIFRII